MTLPPAIFLMGPTASGKTALAMMLADRLANERPVELISVDSAQVFIDMDLGTAKPDAATLARYPHHLIDLITPEERYSAARFRDDALRLMAEITGRGHVPLLVGGTMLYFKALRDDLAELPQADPALRAEIEARAARDGWPALHAELATRDPATARRNSGSRLAIAIINALSRSRFGDFMNAAKLFSGLSSRRKCFAAVPVPKRFISASRRTANASAVPAFAIAYSTRWRSPGNASSTSALSRIHFALDSFQFPFMRPSAVITELRHCVESQSCAVAVAVGSGPMLRWNDRKASSPD